MHRTRARRARRAGCRPALTLARRRSEYGSEPGAQGRQARRQGLRFLGSSNAAARDARMSGSVAGMVACSTWPSA